MSELAKQTNDIFIEIEKLTTKLNSKKRLVTKNT